MSLVVKEWEARIELIRSIAQSQQAMARILDSVADISEYSPEMAKSVRENVRSLTAMQLSMTETVVGIRMRRPQQGIPAKPWLLKGADVSPYR
ncbi:hypothetical protein [Paenibacillus spongiae]|uniref:Uncharacterized protein n=1 Tax=Paenibacillus spongiae TaxID=2909671 RepID=A0ABY5S4M1_9BACL|nr:hypothetical protein [Paenibacillus spongiae]UVI28654.1 hypothetical protein L1F29_24875 [Paenibacillus spongiae]